MKKTRIETTGNSIGIQSPFASLSIEGLPDGPAELMQRPLPPTKLGRVVLRREKSERGGKTVVVVSDFATHLMESEIAEFARKARQSCGCGGTVRGREIELQGDNPAQVRAFFEKAGFRVAGV
jgi:translation initiation factor 1